MLIKNLKQQNQPAFNFALAGLLALLITVIASILLGYSLVQQKQLSKQVANLQKIGQRLGDFSANTRLIYGESAAFTEFEKLVKSFNQQWTNFKQQPNYPIEKIKYADEIWENINDDTKIIISSKNEVMRLHTAHEELFTGIKKIHEKNNQLIHILLGKNMDYRYISLVKETSVSIVNTENYLKKHYPDSLAGGFYGLWGIENVSDTLWRGSDVFRVVQVKDKKIREFLKNYRSLYFEVESLAVDTRNHYGEVYLIDAAQHFIPKHVLLFNETLTEMSDLKINKILMVVIVIGFLSILACRYGYVTSLMKEVKMAKISNKKAFNVMLLSCFVLLFSSAATFLLWHSMMLKKQVNDLNMTIDHFNNLRYSKEFANGEDKAFIEFKRLIKKLNYQCYNLDKSKYPEEAFKKIELARKRININAQKLIAMQADYKEVKNERKQVFINLEKMREINESLVNQLLQEKTDKNHILAAKQISKNLSTTEFEYRLFFEGLGYPYPEPDEYGRDFSHIGSTLNSLWKGGEIDLTYSYQIIDKINSPNVRKTLENEMNLYKKMRYNPNSSEDNVSYYYQAKDFSTGELWSTLLMLNEKINYEETIKIYVKKVDLWLICGWYLVFFMFYIKYRKEVGGILKLILILPLLLSLLSNFSGFYDGYEIKNIKTEVDGLLDEERNIRVFIRENIQLSPTVKVDAFVKLNAMVEAFDKKWQIFRKKHHDKAQYINKIQSSVNQLHKNIKFVKLHQKELIYFYESYSTSTSAIIDTEFEIMSDFNENYNKNNYSVRDLLVMMELGDRLGRLYKYVQFAYTNKHRAILNHHIDFTLADYIKQLPIDTSESDGSLPPKKIQKINDILIALESSKHHFLIWWEFEKLISDLDRQDYELSEYFMKLEKDHASFQDSKGLIVFTISAWLCVLVCGYGYVSALRTRK
jgi:hypothetical protein